MIIPYKNPKMFDTLFNVLERDGVAILPGDTIYGFVGKYPITEKRIRSIKGREEGKPFLVLVDYEILSKLTDQEIPAELKHFWPGPLTLIVRCKYAEGTIAVRIPKDKVQMDLIQRLKMPLFSTSVNRSGELPLNDIHGIIKEFEDKVDLIVDGGNIKEGEPSTIIDITQHPYKLVREGAVKPDLRT